MWYTGAISDPGGIQTHDFQNRNLTFYSTELRGRISVAKVRDFHELTQWTCFI